MFQTENLDPAPFCGFKCLIKPLIACDFLVWRLPQYGPGPLKTARLVLRSFSKLPKINNYFQESRMNESQPIQTHESYPRSPKWWSWCWSALMMTLLLETHPSLIAVNPTTMLHQTSLVFINAFFLVEIPLIESQYQRSPEVWTCCSGHNYVLKGSWGFPDV